MLLFFIRSLPFKCLKYIDLVLVLFHILKFKNVLYFYTITVWKSKKRLNIYYVKKYY